MTVRELYENGIILEGEIKYCYYDYEKCLNVTISKRKAYDKEIIYIYAYQGIMYIEVSNA